MTWRPPRTAAAILIASAGQLRVGVLADRAGQQPPRVQVEHGGQVELAFAGRDLGDVATPLHVRGGCSEVAAQQVGELRRGLALLGQSLTPLGFAPEQPLALHRLRDGVHTHGPAGLEQVAVDPRRAVGALGGAEQRADLRVELTAPAGLRGDRGLDPLVEPAGGQSEDRAAHRDGHPVERPLVGDEACHAHFVASFTHRTTERLRPPMSLTCQAATPSARPGVACGKALIGS